MQFAASTLEQIDGVAALLQESFHVTSDAPSLNRAYLEWKYYAEVPPWPGSRSFVMIDGSQIVAHAAITPVRLRLAGGVREGIGFQDWVSSEAHRGAGLLLLRKLVALSSFVLVTGGAPVTRQILPRAGFVSWADRRLFVRILRPLRQLQTRVLTLGWKEPLRLARNAAWSMRPLAPVRGWTAEPAVPDETILATVEGQLGTMHTVASLEHLLRCPTVRFEFLRLQRDAQTLGYSVLSTVGGQARIADLRIASTSAEDWREAVSAVLRRIRSDRSVCEVSTFGSVPHVDQALVANGFIARDRLPLVVFDTQGQLAQQPLPQLGMLEDDASALYDPASPYRT